MLGGFGLGFRFWRTLSGCRSGLCEIVCGVCAWAFGDEGLRVLSVGDGALRMSAHAVLRLFICFLFSEDARLFCKTYPFYSSKGSFKCASHEIERIIRYLIVGDCLHRIFMSVRIWVFKPQFVSIDKKLYAIARPLMLPIQRRE